ncbi:hypothetical protein M436DRAFT_66792 [Aureobasidium namibiae CBS 147.97]|uniref:Uncharacterized protein n=1 Tax=Aureobasidium namibiae CBS 147.97 TaxID=1043004 RepID=A0A074X5S6_9PEZI|nr:uncharacterized protein M436DRAFT_66792 [Aureobasidium namibiae CBS 147.97]KEQ69941.1 hypothetical protein M436DRAFT_66792 [Aureobasidium namibiae CBS 147.97]
MPDQLKTKVVLAHCEDTWWCIIYGNDSKPIWKTAKGCDTAELALRKMLVSSSDLLFDKFHKDGFVLDGQVDGSSGKTKVFKTHISKQRWEARNVAVTFPDQLPTASSDCCKTRSCPRSKYNTMSSQDTSDIEGMRAQISANLKFLLGSTTFEILTTFSDESYHAIVLDAGHDTAALLNHADYSYSSATKALQALLERTSFMVLQKLREDGIENVTPKKLVSKAFGALPETSAKERGAFSYIPSSGAPADPFGAVPKADPFGSNLTGDSAFGDRCAPHSHAQVRKHPGLNNTVTVNLNGLTVSDTRAFGQGLFGSSQTDPKPRGPFSGFSNEAKSHVNVAFGDEPYVPAARGNNGLFNPPTQSNSGAFGSSVEGNGGIFEASNQSKGGLFDPSAPRDGGMYGSAAPKEGGMFGSSSQNNNDVFGSSAQGNTSESLESTNTPFGRPLFYGQPKPTFRTFADYTPGRLFGGQSHSTPATDPFLSSTPPTAFGDSRVPYGSYRYNPATGTAKVSDRSVPDIAVTGSSPKDAAYGETSKTKPFGEEINKRARLSENESPFLSNYETGENNENKGKATDSSTPSTATTSTAKPAESPFAQFDLEEHKLQQPPPLRAPLFGQTPPTGEASASAQLSLPTVSAFARRIPLGAFPPAASFAPASAFLSVQPSSLTAPFAALNMQASTLASSPGSLFDSPPVASTTPAGPAAAAAAAPHSTPSIHSQNSTYMFDSLTPGARFAPPLPTANEPELELELSGEPEETELFGAEAFLERQAPKGEDEEVPGAKAFAERHQQKKGGDEKPAGEGLFGTTAFLERQARKGQDEKVFGEQAFAQRQESRG